MPTDAVVEPHVIEDYFFESLEDETVGRVRIIAIPYERRVFAVPREQRVFAVEHERRIFAVGGD